MARKVFWFFAEGRKCLLFWPIGMYGLKKQDLLLNVKHFLKNEKNMFYCSPVNKKNMLPKSFFNKWEKNIFFGKLIRL